jgi:hypothetical protein
MVRLPVVMRGRILNNLRIVEFCCYFLLCWLTLFVARTICGVCLDNDLLLLGIGLACIISEKEGGTI